MSNTQTKSISASVIETLAAAGLLLHALLVLGTWNLLPESIPVHFNFAGEADSWGDKSDLLWMLGLSLLVYAGLTWLGRYPHKFNYPWQITPNNAERQYDLARNFLKAIKCEIVWLFAIISLQMIGISLSQVSSLGYLFVPLIITITSATVIGYFIAASRSAFSETQ